MISEGQGPGAGDDPVRRKVPLGITLFDPLRMFTLFVALFGWLRFLKYTVWPFAIFAGMVAIQEWYVMLAHIDRIFLSLNFAQQLIMGLIANNLLSKLTGGTSMLMHGIETRQFGIKLMFGVLPRFFIDRSGIKKLNFKGQRACYAVPLMTKLFVCGFSIFMWAMIRRSGSGAADFFLAIGTGGLMAFLFTANPLWPADGSKWLSAYFKRNNLRNDAFRVMGMVVQRRPLPKGLSASEAWALGLYALATIVFTAVLVYLLLSIAFKILEAEYQGTGVVMFCILLAMVILYIVISLQKKQAGGAKGRKARDAQRPAEAKQSRGSIAARISEPRLTQAAAPKALTTGKADVSTMAQSGSGAATKKPQDDAQEMGETLENEAVSDLFPDPDQKDEAAEDRFQPPDGADPQGDSPEAADAEQVAAEAALDDVLGAPDDPNIDLDAVLADLEENAPDEQEDSAEDDALFSELEAVLSPRDDVSTAQAESDALHALLAEEEEEAELDADPLMSELEALLAPEDTPDDDADGVAELLTEDLEVEAALDSDPLMTELEAALLEDEDDADPLDEDAEFDALLAEDLEEAELDADPLMSELEDALDADEEGLSEDVATLVAEDLDEAELDDDPLMAELEALLAPDPVEADEDTIDETDILEAAAARDLEDIEEAALDADPVMAELEDTLDPDLTELAAAETDLVGGQGDDTLDVDRRSVTEVDALEEVLSRELDDLELDADPTMTEMEEALGDEAESILEELNAAIPAPVPVTKGKRRRGGTDLVPAAETTPAKPKGRKTEVGPARGQYQDLDMVLGRTGVAGAKRSRWKVWLFWLVVLVGLIYVALLPYEYEVGGDFVVQPIAQSQVRARTDGEITEVLVREGDWVERDQVMAILSNWDEKRDIAVLEAELAGQRANLATLTAGPRPEEVALAEEAVRAAELQIDLARQDLERKTILFDRGAITQTSLETSQGDLKVAEAKREEALAALDLVRTVALQSEVDAAEAAIERTQKSLDFARLQLEQTNIRAVTEGQIVSSLVEVPVGAFLVEGALFALLENNREVIAEIEVPETEIVEVREGAAVELKLWSESDASLWGKVLRIAPRAEERDFGMIVRVSVQVPNPDGILTSNMTGYAKVSAREAPVYEVFTLVIMRFLRIELWSWIP